MRRIKTANVNPPRTNTTVTSVDELYLMSSMICNVQPLNSQLLRCRIKVKKVMSISIPTFTEVYHSYPSHRPLQPNPCPRHPRSPDRLTSYSPSDSRHYLRPRSSQYPHADEIPQTYVPNKRRTQVGSDRSIRTFVHVDPCGQKLS